MEAVHCLQGDVLRNDLKHRDPHGNFVLILFPTPESAEKILKLNAQTQSICKLWNREALCDCSRERAVFVTHEACHIKGEGLSALVYCTVTLGSSLDALKDVLIYRPHFVLLYNNPLDPPPVHIAVRTGLVSHIVCFLQDVKEATKNDKDEEEVVS